MNIGSILALIPTGIIRCLRVLAPRDRLKIVFLIILQTLFNFLDLVGIALVGIIGILTVRGVSSHAPSSKADQVLNFFRIQDLSLQNQVAILAICASAFLFLKTLFSIFFTRKSFRFLSIRSANLTTELFSKTLNRPYLEMKEKPFQETLYSLTNGISIIFIGIIGLLVTSIADAALLLILITSMFFVDPITAILVVFIFGSLGLLMFGFSHQKVRKLGEIDYTLTIKSNQKILESLNAYKEILVKNSQMYYVNQVGEIRNNLSKAIAELSFIPYVSKYAFESAVIVGGLIVAGYQFVFYDASKAVATLAIFLAAGTRIGPAVLRLQQSALQIRGNLAVAGPSLNLIEEVRYTAPTKSSNFQFELGHKDFKPYIQISNCFFKYRPTGPYAIKNLEMKISPGEVVVFVGPSGAGKSTLVDLILGVIEPQSGSIMISDKTPREVFMHWPGAIGYVPQDVSIVNGTLRENITLGFNPDQLDDQRIIESVKQAQLDDLLASDEDGLNMLIGDNGFNLSGGQRQRIGIARALITKPKLLVLDEATSALDGETEANISQSIQKLKGEVTVISIAHRLSSVRNADRVYYFEEGSLKSWGSFEEVRSKVPNFDKQASLMGL